MVWINCSQILARRRNNARPGSDYAATSSLIRSCLAGDKKYDVGFGAKLLSSGLVKDSRNHR